MKGLVWASAIVCALICSQQVAPGLFLGAILGAVAGALTYVAWKVFQKIIFPIAVWLIGIFVILAIVAGSGKP